MNTTEGTDGTSQFFDLYVRYRLVRLTNSTNACRSPGSPVEHCKKKATHQNKFQKSSQRNKSSLLHIINSFLGLASNEMLLHVCFTSSKHGMLMESVELL